MDATWQGGGGRGEGPKVQDSTRVWPRCQVGVREPSSKRRFITVEHSDNCHPPVEDGSDEFRGLGVGTLWGLQCTRIEGHSGRTENRQPPPSLSP